MKNFIFLNKNGMYTLRGVCMIFIILHHLNYVNNFCFGNKIINSFFINQGYLSTGVFFLLSGYGLTSSINNNRPINFDYLIKHIKKIFNVYFFFFTVCVVSLFLLDYNISVTKVFKYFITLSMPESPTWFLKTIIGVYILYITLNIFLPQKKTLPITIVSIIGYWIFAHLYLPNYYSNTILNFIVGIFFVKFKTFIVNNSGSILIISLLSFLICFKYNINEISSISYSIITIILFSFITKNIKWITFIGINSLGFYLGQFLPLKISSSLPNNKVIYFIIFFIIVIITNLLYNKLKLIKNERQ